MSGDQKPKRPAWSESDRTKLDELLSERAFDEKLRARRKAAIDSAKAWATWIITMAAAVSLVKDWVATSWKQLIAWALGP